MRKTTASSPGSALERGFTLIEIMVVILIIGLLASLIAPRVIDRVSDARITKAKTDIRGLESQLNLYRLDNFRYPTTEQGLQALKTRPNDPSLTNYRAGGYVDRLPKDPWGNEYQYLNPGTHGTDIDIYTLGADGRPGGEGEDADIGNWDLE